MQDYHIAVIPGDGIGQEVCPEGLKVLDAAADMSKAFRLHYDTFPWGCEYYLEHGQMMADDALKTLEQFDAIGRIRDDNVDTTTRLFDGIEIEGIEGLRDYLINQRRDDVVRQFCRKLLGYSLGRELQLSDEVLLGNMVEELGKQGYRSSVAVKMVVKSRQFREIRGEVGSQ